MSVWIKSREIMIRRIFLRYAKDDFTDFNEFKTFYGFKDADDDYDPDHISYESAMALLQMKPTPQLEPKLIPKEKILDDKIELDLDLPEE